MPVFDWAMGDEVSKTEEIVRELAKAIALKQYVSHSNLPSERKLAEEFGVSRSTIRTALNTLASMSAITINQKQLSVVNDWTQWKLDLIPYVIEHISEDKQALRRILTLGFQFWRTTYLGIIPQLVKQRVSKAEIRRLLEIAWDRRYDPALFIDAVNEVTRASLVGNAMQSYLWLFNELASSFSRFAPRMPHLAGAIAENWQANRQMMDAVADGDPAQAMHFAEIYFSGIENYMFEKLQLN